MLLISGRKNLRTTFLLEMFLCCFVLLPSSFSGKPPVPRLSLFSPAAVMDYSLRYSVFEGHPFVVICSSDSSQRVRSFSLSANGVYKLPAVDNAAHFTFPNADLKHGKLRVISCTYNFDSNPEVNSSQALIMISFIKPSYARLVGEESRCIGSLELEHEGEWRAVSQQHWGLKEAAVVCRQLHCGSVIITDSQSRQMQPVWRFYSDCDGSERALLGCGSVRKEHSSSTVHVLCSDVLHQPTVSLVAANQLTQEDPMVVYSPFSFYINCSVLPQFPGGHFSLAFTGDKHSLILNQTAVNHSTVFTFDVAEKTHSGNYSCIYHNTVFGRNFSSQSQDITIVVKETQSEVRECVLSGRDESTVHCSRGMACFGLWEQRPGGELLLLKQGCWESQPNCLSDHCLVTVPPTHTHKAGYKFCCCSRDLCNGHFSEALPTVPSPVHRLPDSHDLLLDDGLQRNNSTKACAGKLLLRHRTSQMKMVTVETSGWDKRHASIVCRQLDCGNSAVSTSKIELPNVTPMWRFYSDCDGTEAALLQCGHVQQWFSSKAIAVVCGG